MIEKDSSFVLKKDSPDELPTEENKGLPYNYFAWNWALMMADAEEPEYEDDSDDCLC